MLAKGLKKIKITLLLWLIFTILTGVLYPLSITLIAKLTCPWKASGSFVRNHDKRVGSLLIGQPFSDLKYFWGRISATPDFPYNALYSSGSNLAPTNPLLLAQVKERIKLLQEADPLNKNDIPVDLVTASGSGLDPDISLEAAIYQVPRVARVRKIQEKDLHMLIQYLAKNRILFFLGQPRVNVLELNLALDGLEKTDAT